MQVPRISKQSIIRELKSWPPRRWAVVGLSSMFALLAMGLPTAVIENPVFGRSVGVTAWSMPVLAISAILSGLLVGTYVNPWSVFEQRQGKVGASVGCFPFSLLAARFATSWCFLRSVHRER